MVRILVVYYSSYGHVERLAAAQAEGAARVPGASVALRRVPETLSAAAATAMGFRLDQPAPLATPDELADYDAILFGTPTRFGNMAGQMRSFLDGLGGLWMQNRLVGKVGSAFCSTASQHGGHETTLTSFHTTLLHLGMIVVGLPSTCPGLSTMTEVAGGSPYGAGCIAGGGPHARMPTPLELDNCRFQGEHVARIAARLARGADAA